MKYKYVCLTMVLGVFTASCDEESFRESTMPTLNIANQVHEDPDQTKSILSIHPVPETNSFKNIDWTKAPGESNEPSQLQPNTFPKIKFLNR